MARTYGEIVEESFAEVFKISSGEDTIFVDIGSGHGLITIAAVQDFGCCFGLGIEKYREPQAICDKRVAKLADSTKSKLRFVLEDINDTDLLEHFSGIPFQKLLIFCNNLAFTQGTVNRLARKLGEVMSRLPDEQVHVVSTVPLPPIEDRFCNHIMLHMSWTQEAHQSCVYSNGVIC